MIFSANAHFIYTQYFDTSPNKDIYYIELDIYNCNSLQHDNVMNVLWANFQMICINGKMVKTKSLPRYLS